MAATGGSCSLRRGCSGRAVASGDTLEFKWGGYLANGTTVCPTNMSDSHVAPFTFTGAL